MSKNAKPKSSRRVAEARDKGLESVLAAYPDIVEALVEQAKGGSCPHAKLVFELMEPAAKRGAAPDEAEEPQSLVEYLLEQLQLEPPPEPSPGATSAGSSVACPQ